MSFDKKVVWGSCQRDPYLRARSSSILELLNLIRDQFKDSVIDHIERALEIAAITSVDDNAESKQAVQKCGHRVRFDSIEVKAEQLRESGINSENMKIWSHLWEPIDRFCNNNPQFQINFAKTACTLNNMGKERSERQMLYVVNPAKKSLGLKIYVKVSTGKVDVIHQRIEQLGLNIPQEIMVIESNQHLLLENQLASVLGKDNFIRILDIILAELIQT